MTINDLIQRFGAYTDSGNEYTWIEIARDCEAGRATADDISAALDYVLCWFDDRAWLTDELIIEITLMFAGFEVKQ
jgi:hypothetical protein